MADLECVDLWGVASMETARLQLERRFTAQNVSDYALARGARIALTYLELPLPWLKVGEWQIRENLVCAWPTVSFFAADAQEAERLKQRLRAFGPRLPPDVTQRGVYLGR